MEERVMSPAVDRVHRELVGGFQACGTWSGDLLIDTHLHRRFLTMLDGSISGYSRRSRMI